MTTSNTVTVYGNWGDLTCDAATGLVLSYQPGGDFDPANPAEGYGNIARVNLDEFRAFLSTHGIEQKPMIDVLNLGYWTADSAYITPAADYRAMWLPNAIAARSATPKWHAEFPEFAPADMPTIPADWQDMSWHNDACPSFAFMIGGEGDSNNTLARVWVDWVDPADREGGTDSKRFLVTYEADDGTTFDALQTDDWAEVLAYVEARKALGAAYADAIGYNPFLDDPSADPVEVAATLAEHAALAGNPDFDA